jgi:hypothetical protein
MADPGQSLGTPLAGALLSTYVASYTVGNYVLVLPTRAAFQYCFYADTFAWIVAGLLTIFAREVMRKRADKQVPEQSTAE